MSNAAVQYRFRIYSTDDTTVETTFDTELQGWESVGGQEVRALKGRAETRPWSIRVVDYSTAVTNDLADSSGRLRRLGRLADFQQNLDSSGWATLATGRISDVFLGDDVAAYQFVMEDEHMKARQAPIFTSTSHTPSCYLYPPGLRSKWMDQPARQVGNAMLLRRSVNLSYIGFQSSAPVSAIAMRELTDDVRGVTQSYFLGTTAGNFKFLRFHGGGADYEVWSVGGEKEPSPDPLKILTLPPEEQTPMGCWVVDPTTALGSATYASGTTVGLITAAYLYSPGLPPSEGQPWHIGGENGTHPFQHLKDTYDGNYGDTTIRYDSTAMAAMIANKVFPVVGYRITAPRLMGEHTESGVYGAFGAAGFVSRDGRIMPRSLFLPSTNEVDQSSLFEFTAANLREPHPTWQHGRGDLVTVLEIVYRPLNRYYDREVPQRGYDVPADLLYVPTLPPQTYAHDRLGIGRIAHRLPEEPITGSIAWQSAIAQEIFDRFGDGPIQGQFPAMSSGTSGVLPGDFVKVTLATYPNVGIQGRGNTRIVQILSAQDTPYGPVFDYLDAGPNSTVLAVPTISLTTGTNNPYHEIIATVGSVAEGFELQLAEGTSGTSGPVVGSSAWEYAYRLLMNATSDDYTIDRRKSGQAYFGRARNVGRGRWRSGWAYTTAGTVTQALTAPTNVLTTGYTDHTANVSWTNSTASTGYELDAGLYKDPDPGDPFWIVTDALPAGTNRHQLNIPDEWMGSSSDPFQAWVRYRDPFGGVSTYAQSANFNLTTTPPTGDNWSTSSTAIVLYLGRNTTGDVY